MKKILQTALFLTLLLSAGYCFLHTPFQEIPITARTATFEYDLSGETSLYIFKPLKAGQTYQVKVSFEAVPSRSGNLFAFFGSGKTVQFGCSPLTASAVFTSVGRFACIRLRLYVPKANLTLEDGSRFDPSRYALKPIVTIESPFP